MRITIGQIFRVPHSGTGQQCSGPRYENYKVLTAGSYGKGADIQKGIFKYKAVRCVGGEERHPAFILSSDNLKGQTESNPWLDIIEPNEGYAVYHGDNRTPGQGPFEGRHKGNKKLKDLFHLYRDPGLRVTAPPLLVFENAQVNGKRKGYRRFAGYGIPTKLELQSQHTPSGTFTNLVIDVALFSLTDEQELFDWSWIDARKDPQYTAEDCLKKAPAAWRQWVRSGDGKLTSCRRKVYRKEIVSAQRQMPQSQADASVLQSIYDFYNEQATAHAFEGLASFICQRILGSGCERGWATTPSGDKGVDFISKYTFGHGFSHHKVVVIGQAKRLAPGSSVSGLDLARTAAKLKRGWLGVVVTTGVYSTACQQEVAEDNYPLVLINGAQVAEEVRKELAQSGQSLQDFLAEELQWYRSHIRNITPEQAERV